MVAVLQESRQSPQRIQSGLFMTLTRFSLVMASIRQAVLQVMQPRHSLLIPKMDAPGILDIQPRIRPTGQTARQKGR